MKKDFFSEIHNEEDSPLIRSIREKLSGNSDLEFKINKEDSPLVQSIKRKLNTKEKSESSSVSGLKENVNTLYDETKFNSSQGHGFAAERANDLFDRLLLKDAKIEGDNNLKDGADRLVNGVSIQSKYCKTGAGCINACFRDGKFRYFQDGKPMVIEVPSDKYESALKAMQKRIEKGEVDGITNPLDAEKYVQKGHFTYEQAKNVAKAGTVESLAYDGVNNAIKCGNVLGTSAAMSFATAVWNGKDIKEASKIAILDGIKSGGKTFIRSVLSSQLNKSGLDGVLKKSSDIIVQNMSKEASEFLVKAFRDEISDKAIKGAASKILRGNLVSSIANFTVTSVPDIVKAFRGKITVQELTENLAKNGASVAGGTAGWIAGAAAGAKLGASAGSLFGPVGTVVGGTLGTAGGIAGSYLGGKMAEKSADYTISEVKKKISDNTSNSDLGSIVNNIEDKVVNMAADYLLNITEVKTVIDKIAFNLMSNNSYGLKELVLSENKEQSISDLVLSQVLATVKNRVHITNEMLNDNLLGGLSEGLKMIKKEV
ncbi:hypothetical protein [Megamonas hypermegale]|uniref:hypothetical protein n=1 Tax=Megamonas hypermegale TaxID=158847 RepID=UPI0026EDD203|nr:hypothetical protein [Megamonas hypermegale]